ncbi:unnamed protein product [Heligmosomoides polygyrus]|uniref:Uncharacterized protein n=1 Tax=Heligmosomoides polygyrus TaxID=6339 RepID=A0A183FRR0_HELPZ|nr:unnamed protein product [Heligmosomoides polygyrus]
MTIPSMSAHVNPQQMPTAITVALPGGMGQSYFSPQNIMQNAPHHQLRQNVPQHHQQQQQQQAGVQYG